MDAYRCPKCAAEVGATVEEIDIQCWQCGLEFYEEEGTEPVLREKFAATWRPMLCWVGAVLAPGFLYWLVLHAYDKLWRWIPLLGGFWIFPAAGLTLFGVCCVLYAVDRLNTVDRGFAWLLRAVFFVILFFTNFFLLLAAISAVAH